MAGTWMQRSACGAVVMILVAGCSSENMDGTDGPVVVTPMEDLVTAPADDLAKTPPSPDMVARCPPCGDAGTCDVDLGRCRGCLSDGECPKETPFCNRQSGQCEPCTPGPGDRCAPGFYCEVAGPL